MEFKYKVVLDNTRIFFLLQTRSNNSKNIFHEILKFCLILFDQCIFLGIHSTGASSTKQILKTSDFNLQLKHLKVHSVYLLILVV